MKRSLILTALSFLALVQLAWAQVPQTINYQGVLRDGGGNIVENGTYYVTFSIYDAVGATTPAWTSGSKGVSVTDGVFSVILGQDTSLPESFPSPAWLGIKVKPDTDEMPRIELTAVPYSLQAGRVSGADNVFPGSGSVGIGTATPSQKLDVNGTVLANGFALNNPNTKISSLTTDNIDLITNNAARVRVDPSGNVGIGTTAPTAKLDVVGTVKADSLILPTTTRYYSIPTSAFIPSKDYTGYDRGFSFLYPTSGPAEFLAPVNLPHGAVIKELQVTVADDSTSNILVYLYNTNLSTGNNGQYASLSSAGIAEVGTVSSATLSVSVNNQTYAYMVRVYFPSRGSANGFCVMSARIKYTVTTPLP